MPSPDTVAGRYEILEVLTRRDPQVTYKVRDTFLNRHAALVTLAEPVSAAVAQSLVSECAVLMSVNHPAVAEVLDRGYLDEGRQTPFYVVTYAADGLRLDELIQAESRRLTPPRVAEFMSLVCRGVQAARDAGAATTAVEPGDIIVFKSGAARIQRFVSGAGADDVRSLGSICYAALSFRLPPFPAEVADLTAVNPEVPDKLASVVRRAMDADPGKRYATPFDLAEALLTAAAAGGSASAVPTRADGPLDLAEVTLGAAAAASQPDPTAPPADGPGDFTRMFQMPVPQPEPKPAAEAKPVPKATAESSGVGDFTRAFKLPSSYTDRPLPDHIAPGKSGEPVRVKSTAPPEPPAAATANIGESRPDPAISEPKPRAGEDGASGIFEPRVTFPSRPEPREAPFVEQPFPRRSADSNPAAADEPSAYSKYIKIPNFDSARPEAPHDLDRTKIFDSPAGGGDGGRAAVPDSSEYDRVANRPKPAEAAPAVAAQKPAQDRKLILIASLAGLVIIAVVVVVFVLSTH